MTFRVRCRAYTMSVCALFFLSLPPIHADWNQDFDNSNVLLLQELPQLQESQEYRDWQSFFLRVRKKIVDNEQLKSRLSAAGPDRKVILKLDQLGVVVKKRKVNHINDIYPWELACMLGATEYVVPAFPADIGGIRVVLQPIEKFTFGRTKGKGLSQATLAKVTAETYWLAHLQAYLFGFSDLAARNIGVARDGTIRWFDNETAFTYYNTAFKNDVSFAMGFISHSFDWPQYRLPIDKKTANSIKKFIQKLSGYEEKLDLYLQYRPITFSREGLQFRLDKMREFQVTEGVTFRDFLGFLYPKMSPGLDTLNRIVGDIWGKKVDHGSSLFFICKMMGNYKLTSRERAALQNWVNTYVD